MFLAGGQISLLDVSGASAPGSRAPRPLTRHATGVYGGVPPVWSPDGSAIYFLASDPPTDVERERTRLRDDVYAYDEDYRHRHVWKVIVATGAEQRVTGGRFTVLSFRVSRDGTRLVLHRAPTPLTDDNNKSDIWLVDADGGNPQAVTANEVEEFEAELSPDNSRVLFISDAHLEPYNAASLFVVPATGGTATQVLPDFPYSFDRVTWSPDGAAILAVVNMGVHSEIFRIDVAARRATALTDGRHSVQFWSVVPSAGRMAFQLDEPTRLGDVWTMPIDGGTPTRITGVYDTLARDFDLPRQEKVSWASADGTTIEGMLFYPSGFQPGQRVPLVVQLHGGPMDSDKFGFGPGVIMNYVPVLTAKGYAVLRPNYRGSTGYGSEFMRDVIGGYFRNMQQDVLSGVDFLIREGIVDGDRLAVMGWSAGGHLANKLITVTTRFKAASSAAGVANWISLFGESDTWRSRAVWFGGLPWGANAPVDSFWNQSPVKDVANVRTPTLITSGEEDPRVPLRQAVELYRALLANNVPARLYVAPREGHQWTELRHQLFKANAELEWFERYVTGRTYTWERAPGDPPGAPAP